MYRKSNVRRKGGPAGGTGGSLESCPLLLVLPLRDRSENAACDNSELLHDVSYALAKHTSPTLVQLDQRNQD